MASSKQSVFFFKYYQQIAEKKSINYLISLLIETKIPSILPPKHGSSGGRVEALCVNLGIQLASKAAGVAAVVRG